MKTINTKTSSLFLAGAVMLATVVPAFAAPAVTPAPATKAPAVTIKSNKVSSLKKKTPVAMKKSTNKVASVKKAK